MLSSKPLRGMVVIRTGILTASTLGARGEREDTSGVAIRDLSGPIGASVDAYEVVTDERDTIASVLRSWADDLRFDLILTTDGTGLLPSAASPDTALQILE